MGWTTVKEDQIRYTELPANGEEYTRRMNRMYTLFARGVYDLMITLFPVWKKWICSVLPYIRGPRVLEVSFGNGYLMTRYAGTAGLRVDGIDFNHQMVELTRRKMTRRGSKADLQQGTVEALPYDDGSFDTVINTMAFTGYPDGDRALAEMVRVLRPGGSLLLLDFDYPEDRNRIGWLFVRIADRVGDVMKDMRAHVERQGLEYRHSAVGASGSVHLYVCTRPE